MSLVVADGLGNEALDGVKVIDTGKSRGRRDRMLRATRRVLDSALDLNADLYHLHDPELLPIGLTLKRRGKRVIFDSHEDLPAQILTKPYLWSGLRAPISGAVSLFERFACGRVDAVAAATPAIQRKFAKQGVYTLDINNFPLLGELEAGVPWDTKQKEICYVGGIAEIRGIREVVAAMALSKSGARLNLGGEFPKGTLRAEVAQDPGWSKVDELGFLSREDVRAVLGRSVAGLVTFLPAPNHTDAQPNKMFEYMSAGIPVIASNFPLWREIIEGSDCGLCVDPLDPSAIAKAIDWLVENPELARRKGENGRRAVHERYNWGAEEKKLLGLYERVLGQT